MNSEPLRRAELRRNISSTRALSPHYARTYHLRFPSTTHILPIRLVRLIERGILTSASITDRASLHARLYLSTTSTRAEPSVQRTSRRTHIFLQRTYPQETAPPKPTKPSEERQKVKPTRHLISASPPLDAPSPVSAPGQFAPGPAQLQPPRSPLNKRIRTLFQP